MHADKRGWDSLGSQECRKGRLQNTDKTVERDIAKGGLIADFGRCAARLMCLKKWRGNLGSRNVRILRETRGFERGKFREVTARVERPRARRRQLTADAR